MERLDYSKLYYDMVKTADGYIKYDRQEVLSWIDSLHLIYKAFSDIGLNGEVKEHTQIFQEFSIPFTPNNRADIILTRENKIIIVEFAFRIKKFTKKSEQCIVYKEILKQQTNPNLDYYIYIFSYTDEEELNDENECKLKQKLEKFIRFLNKTLGDKKEAYDGLLKLENINNY